MMDEKFLDVKLNKARKEVCACAFRYLATIVSRFFGVYTNAER